MVAARGRTIYTFETLSSVRFLVQYSQQQYLAHGCYPTSAEFSIGPGEVPQIKLTYAVSWWETRSATFPNATSVQDFGAVGDGTTDDTVAVHLRTLQEAFACWRDLQPRSQVTQACNLQ